MKLIDKEKIKKHVNVVKNFTNKCINAVKKFFIKAELPCIYVVISLFTLYLRQKMFYGKTGDFNGCLDWYTTIKQEGIKKALSHKIGDYTPAYFYVLALLTKIPIDPLYSIKTVSCAFDFVLAIFVALCVREFNKNKFVTLTAYTITLLLPSIFLNSAAWGQCDGIFTSFCVISVYLLLKKKNVAAVFTYGIAFSFKLQAIFLAPLFAVLFFKRKIPLWSPLLVLFVYFLFCIPSWICGRNLKELLLIYREQADEYTYLTMNAPTFVALFGTVTSYHSEHVSSMLVTFTVIITALLIYISARHARFKKESIIDISFMFSLVVPFFLPHMHERYFYLSTTLSVIYVLIHPKRYYTLILSEFCSLFVTFNYLYIPRYLKLEHVALIELVNVILLLRALWKDYRPTSQDKQNPSIENTSNEPQPPQKSLDFLIEAEDKNTVLVDDNEKESLSAKERASSDL